MLPPLQADTRRTATLPQLLRQARSIARIDVGFFFRRAKFVWSIAAIALIPALYSVIYLSSLWDPASHSQALTVGIVNLDQGLVYRESNFNVGQELSQTLQNAARFNYRTMRTAEEARLQVRQGKLSFALIIPANFSSNAVPGEQAGAGQLVVFASQGNNVETARIAQQFAAELGHKVNGSLNAQRWSLVLLNAAGSQQSVSQLNRGLKELHQGATELSVAASNAAIGAKSVQTGARQLSDNVAQLTQNSKKLGAGLRQMETSRPRNAELKRLDAGTDALVNGVSELGQGLQQLNKGSRELATQVSLFKEESDNSFLVSATGKGSVTQAAQGVQQLDQGLHTAVDSGQKLEDGAKTLRAGVNTLTAGVRGMNNALRTAVGQFPEDAQLDALESGSAELTLGTTQMAQGTEQLSSGSKRLQMGLGLVEKAIPDMGETPEGSPEGLADSVRPVVEMDAAVQNNGIGFIANVIPAALWLGASIAVFVVNLRSLPKQAKPYHPVAQWLGKLLLPGSLVLLQCLLILFTVFVVLQVNVVNPWALTCTIVSAGLAFLCVISALTCFMGDAGKATAMVLLALQMTSSGGVMPVELSGSFFATLSPWLPITWLAHGLKASLFGAYEGAWLLDWVQVSCVGLGAAALTMLFGRWRFVPVRQLKPQLDL
nr:YhgE/Pip family protein [uncultured Limnohabitans sp.]